VVTMRSVSFSLTPTVTPLNLCDCKMWDFKKFHLNLKCS
jgi:hypothetical protein